MYVYIGWSILYGALAGVLLVFIMMVLFYWVHLYHLKKYEKENYSGSVLISKEGRDYVWNYAFCTMSDWLMASTLVGAILGFVYDNVS